MTRSGSGLTLAGDAPWRTKVPFSVLIADGDDDFRDLVRRHLGAAVVVVGDVGDGVEAVRLARRLRPDVVLMDIAVPSIGGPEAARRIKAFRSETKIIFLTGGAERAAPRGEDAARQPTLENADALLQHEKVRLGILSSGGRIAAKVGLRGAAAGRVRRRRRIRR